MRNPEGLSFRLVSEGQTKSFRKSIARNLESRAEKPGGGDEYAGSLITHYGSAMPTWVFLEVVPFGTKLAFYLFLRL